MNLIKFFFFSTIILFSATNIEAQNSVEDIKGDVEFERYIKYNFQEQSFDRTQYNIAFFVRADSLEFWGHGRKYLSILGPVTYNLESNSDSLSTFKNKVFDTFDYFQNEIVRNKRLYEHVDITIFDDLIFSCYMDRDIPRYAFWYQGKKYNIGKSSLEYLKVALEEYFR